MKTLCLATLLLVGYSSLSQIKSFDDLRGIDSEEAFIRVCLENGYTNIGSSPIYPSLNYRYMRDKAEYHHRDTVVKIDRSSPYESELVPTQLEFKKGEWEFREEDINTKRMNGKSYYDKILAEVKSECAVFELKESSITYDCPTEGWFTDGVKFKGKITFFIIPDLMNDLMNRTEKIGIILHSFPD